MDLIRPLRGVVWRALCTTTVAAVVWAPTPASALPVQGAAVARVVQPVPPEESPCPGGEPKPCGASDQNNQQAKGDYDDAKAEKRKAEQDVAASRQKAEECPPGNQECMQRVTQGAPVAKADFDQNRTDVKAQQEAMQPTANVGTATQGGCAEFAALLPVDPATTVSYTGICGR
ncbi:hypothetical protein, partial [Streptomyces sp. NPDC059564]|uniref:hypothetical protein n=1 Tax=Streptomyces sp. NPDC059564 TaxID=3346865 RepID=UPI0036753F61